MLTQDQKNLLIRAGGCACTLNPFNDCTKCGRPAIGGQSTAIGFVAQTIDNGIITQADRPSISHLPLEIVKRLTIVTNDPRIPRLTLEVAPEKGERLFRFTRRIHRTAAGGGGVSQAPISVEVIEVRNADGWAVRLYLHPLQGPILSTKDLYF